MSTDATVYRRRALQWCLVPVVLVTIGLGYWYPVFGYTVPLVMVAGMIGGVLRGRYVCGNLCPRGGFLERAVGLVNRRRSIPGFLRHMGLRWLIFAVLMGLLVVRISQRPPDTPLWQHVGRVFWLMCVVTTGIGVVLGVLIQPRLWCAFCPMGTMQNLLGGGKRQLRIDAESCIACRLCEKACPLNLSIVKHKDGGRLEERDCLKCAECVAACPRQALSWQSVEE